MNNTIPNWVDSFRDFPKIPETKRYIKGQNITEELSIAFKLMHRQTLTKAEENKFLNLKSFYNELRNKLRLLEYKNFSSDEIEQFKSYISYAFNYRIFASNNITIFSTYRLIINENALKKNKPITDVKFLSYPPLDIVKKLGKFNRANTPNCTLFYSCENINTSLKEIKPPKNKLITVGVWTPKKRNRFNGYAISNSERAGKVNTGVKKANESFNNSQNQMKKLFFDFAKNYLDLIGEEFTKDVNHHYEYIISALFAESTLYDKDYNRKTEDFECIIYPSVGNNFYSDNVAFVPEIIDNEFILQKAIEFEVEEQYYDDAYRISHPEEITLAKVKNKKISKSVIDGKINW